MSSSKSTILLSLGLLVSLAPVMTFAVALQQVAADEGTLLQRLVRDDLGHRAAIWLRRIVRVWLRAEGCFVRPMNIAMPSVSFQNGTLAERPANALPLLPVAEV